MLKAWRRSAGPAFAAAAAINEDDGDAIYFLFRVYNSPCFLYLKIKWMYVCMYVCACVFLYDDIKIQIDFSLITEMSK